METAGLDSEPENENYRAKCRWSTTAFYRRDA